MSDGLYDSNFLLKALMDYSSDSIYFKDRKSRFIMVNMTCAKKHGRDSPEDVIGETDFDAFANEHAGKAYADEQQIIRTGEPMSGMEEKEVWPDGRITWASSTKMALKSYSGEIIGVFGITRDITSRKEAELRSSFYDEQIRRIKERIEEDVRLAAELQKTFFPRSYPCFPAGVSEEESCVSFLHHYHASGMVSGDFCAIRRVSETESGIFLCDVMGHGVRAALGTALIYAMLEDVSQRESDPGRFLGHMNELLLPLLRQEDTFLYATACFLIFDAATGRVRFANAGHPMPLHFKTPESQVEWLMDDESMRGPALGIAEQAEYQTIEEQIQPGESVVLFTDGLYEIEGPEGEEFGEERLIRAARRYADLPLDPLFASLISEACHFSGQAEFNDDVCLVGFTFNELMNG